MNEDLEAAASQDEREARVLGSIIRNYERICKISGGESAVKPKGAKERLADRERLNHGLETSISGGPPGDDTDAVRRALAERIVKLRTRLLRET